MSTLPRQSRHNVTASANPPSRTAESPSVEAPPLPPEVRFGTSTWTYEGWKGTIYKKTYSSEKAFRQQSLAEYAAFPLFRTVGIDSTFYQPAKAATLQSYASQVPADFQWVSKVWERLTVPQFPKHARYGAHAGRLNPDFLNAELFSSSVLAPYADSALAAHAGPFVFQFPHINHAALAPSDFFAKLRAFLTLLPKEFRYATEIRNREYLSADYFSVLNDTGATHCFNHWQLMPRLRDQMVASATAGGLQAPYYVARLLTPLGISYEQAVKLFSPYREMQRPNEEMRHDAAMLALRAHELKRPAFIIVNNRAEGYAPGTIEAITETVRDRLR